MLLGSSIVHSENQLSELANLAAWWDASDSSTITHSSGSVSQITDKSGNGHTLTQGTSTAQPKINTQTLNGLPVLDFDGGDSLSASTGTIGKNVTAITTYIVLRFDTDPTTIAFSISDGYGLGVGNRRLELNQYLNALWWVHRRVDNGSENFNTSYENPHNKWNVYSCRTDFAAGTTRQFWGERWVENDSVSTGTTSNTNNLAVVLGQGFWTTFNLDGQIAEVLIYHAHHSDATMALVNNYLRKKWGLFPKADGQITWDVPTVIGTDLSSLANQSNQTLEYGWVFATTPASVGGITFSAASLDDETGEGSGASLYSHPNTTFQNLLDGYEFSANPVTLTLTGLTAGSTYEVQLFSIDARTTSNLNSRRCYFYDTSNNASNTFLAGDGVYVKGRFVAAGTTQVVKAFSLPPEGGGSGAAGFVNMAILRKFKDTSMVRGYAAHWDASDSSTITQSGGLVSEWRDKSGNGYHLSQSTDANKPRIDTHTQNSLPVMDFNGTTQYLLAGSNNLLRNATGTTIYCVAKVEDGGSGSPNTRTMLFVSNGSNVQNSRALLDVGRTTNKPAVAGRRLDADSLGELVGTDNYGASRYAVYTGILDYANSDAYLYIDQGSNGSTTSFQTSGNSSDTTSLQLTVGSNGAIGNFFDGQIAELLVYNVAHTEAERLTVWTELYRKWNLVTGRIQWQAPADIGSGSSCLNTPSGQTLEYGWRFTPTSGTVNGITFAEASCDNESGEEASGGTSLNYTNSDSAFQNLLNTCEYNFGTTTPMLELTLTGLTAFTYYEVQLFYVDKRTAGNHNNRRQRFEDVYGNVSDDYRVGDEKYVIGRFVADSTTQKIRVRYTSGGDTAAASISLLVLRRFN